MFPHAIDSLIAPLFEAMNKVDMSLTGTDTEHEHVFRWRWERSHQMGCDLRLADRVAASQIDLHQLEDLISSGCPPRTAYRILRP